MRTQQFEKLKNTDNLSKIIYFNFMYLENEPGITFSYKDIYDTLTSPNLLGWFLINDNNKIIGYLIGIKQELADGRYVYYISYFYIINKYRNKGLGTKMMLDVINHITNIGIKFVMLTSQINSNAFNLYKKLGYVDEPIIKLNNSKYTILLYYC